MYPRSFSHLSRHIVGLSTALTVLVVLTLLALTSQSAVVAQEEVVEVQVDELFDGPPTPYEGKRLRVLGEVKYVVTEQAFFVGNEKTTVASELLVVGPEGLFDAPVEVGTSIAVLGTLHVLGMSRAVARVIDITDPAYAQYQNTYVLLTDAIEPANQAATPTATQPATAASGSPTTLPGAPNTGAGGTASPGEGGLTMVILVAVLVGVLISLIVRGIFVTRRGGTTNLPPMKN